MSNILKDLVDRGLVRDCPDWLISNTQYLAIMGSHAYGCADTSVKDKVPDYDTYGWVIPPKAMIFPHVEGHVPGFGPKPPSFEKPWSKHHIMDPTAMGGKGQEWDITVYGIVRYFELLRQNNPNMVDSLFVPDNYVLVCTSVGQLVRDNRKMFLSKEAWPKFRGYAHSSLKKGEGRGYIKLSKFETANEIPHDTTIEQVMAELQFRCDYRGVEDAPMSGSPLEALSNEGLMQYYGLHQKNVGGSDRKKIVDEKGDDVKHLYHIVRLYDEIDQILTLGDLDLQRAREPMKAVRRGDWKLEEIKKWATEKEKALEVAYANCTLPAKAPTEELRKLLLSCLEMHYGSMEKCVQESGWAEKTLRDFDALLSTVRSKLYA